MRSTNPIFNSDRFLNVSNYDFESMTVSGAASKTFILLAIMFLSSGLSWYLNAIGSGLFGVFMVGGFILGFILSLLIIFKKHLAPKIAPFYAICQGFAVGGISILFSNLYAGLPIAALGLTVSTAAAMLLIYKLEIIKVTNNFKFAIISATGGIAVTYFVMMLLNLFGLHISIFDLGIMGIVIQFIIVGIAALNLVLDFDFIVNAEKQGLPKYMEWYAAFGLLVTLIWLYLEILKLLARLSRRK